MLLENNVIVIIPFENVIMIIIIKTNNRMEFGIVRRGVFQGDAPSPLQFIIGGARGVVVIAVGNERGDTSSNPGRDRLHFTLH